jgi:3-methyladenine DNA glycosylase AlkD
MHEERLCALLILCAQFKKSTDPGGREKIHRLYCRNIQHVNNWDLVDASAPTIVGGFLQGRSREQLDRWARSRSLWRRRIAMLATLHFIKQDDFTDALRIADRLLTDDHDLIHKAVGWMLREVGKRDPRTLDVFLRTRYRRMPRTMLRYAIEKAPESERRKYLRGAI